MGSRYRFPVKPPPVFRSEEDYEEWRRENIAAAFRNDALDRFDWFDARLRAIEQKLGLPTPELQLRHTEVYTDLMEPVCAPKKTNRSQ